ncbi:hypothetical protein J6590_055978 [Homalodisca vitripennis]|nr:hypothetical protein J6590_055978 [Homalodisca vitripennis]
MTKLSVKFIVKGRQAAGRLGLLSLLSGAIVALSRGELLNVWFKISVAFDMTFSCGIFHGWTASLVAHSRMCSHGDSAAAAYMALAWPDDRVPDEPWCVRQLAERFFDVLQYHEVLQRLYETYGPIVREKIGSSTVVHVFDPDDARTIYRNEGKMPYVVPLQETDKLYRQKAEMSPGLGNTNGEEWYRLRAAVRHLMLKPQDVQQFLPGVREVAKDLVERLHVLRDQSGFVPNLAVEIGKWSQESAGVVCFDKRLGYLSDGPQQAVIEEIIKANRTVFYLSGLLKFSLPIYKYIPTPKWRKLVAAEHIVVRTARKNTEEALLAVSKLADNNQLTGKRFSFLLSLMAKRELSKEDIIIVMLSLNSDGLSTSKET